MKFYYPVIISRKQDGTFHGTFPDLEMCDVDAGSLNDLLFAAQEAAYSWIDVEMHEDEPIMPPATDLEDLHPAEGEDVRMILVNYRLTEGWDE